MFPIQDVFATRSSPVVTRTLIAANVLVFFVEIFLSEEELARFFWHFALIPARYFGGSAEMPPAEGLAGLLPFVTSMFLHAGWLHLILNMWALWVFGPAIEDRLGRMRYLLFYLATGIAASLTHALFNPDSVVPAVGASGAISGVMGCYVRLFPFSRLVVIVPILIIPMVFEVPALIFIGMWFTMQILQATVEFLAPSDGGGVAWWAHVGGFAFGLAWTNLLGPWRRR